MRIFLNKIGKVTSASGADLFARFSPHYYSCLLLQVCQVHF